MQHLRLIDGGLARRQRKVLRPPSREDVEAEAARRLKLAGYDRYRARFLTTGRPIPHALQYLKIRIDWVAQALSEIDPIPPDYADDRYWPEAV